MDEQKIKEFCRWANSQNPWKGWVERLKPAVRNNTQTDDERTPEEFAEAMVESIRCAKMSPLHNTSRSGSIGAIFLPPEVFHRMIFNLINSLKE